MIIGQIPISIYLHIYVYISVTMFTLVTEILKIS